MLINFYFLSLNFFLENPFNLILSFIKFFEYYNYEKYFIDELLRLLLDKLISKEFKF